MHIIKKAAAPGECNACRPNAWQDLKKPLSQSPGEIKLAVRRLDTHINGFEKLGAKFLYDTEDAFFHLTDERTKRYLHILDEPSVTGTANVLMASVMANGTTTIYNAACEPYIQQLCKMLNGMGAKIERH